MEQQEYLIDSNVVIDYLGKKFPLVSMRFLNNVIDSIPNISIITKIEVLGFITTDEHYKLLEDFMADASVLDLSNNIVDQTIKIRKFQKTKLPDSIIAATAIINDFILLTRNVKDFDNIPNLKIINPWIIEDS